MKKKIAALVLTFVFALSAAACGSSAAGDTGSAAAGNAEEAAEVTIKVGANITPHSEILEQAKPLLKEKGINLEV
ncbi:MAG: methionine ABC transporter substrate-binding protein, partial [Lachnospiraceae bacterium]|nr:methionine ABC transporter substrate-binding protein [Lachnospiraceae bacterium]